MLFRARCHGGVASPQFYHGGSGTLLGYNGGGDCSRYSFLIGQIALPCEIHGELCDGLGYEGPRGCGYALPEPPEVGFPQHDINRGVA